MIWSHVVTTRPEAMPVPARLITSQEPDQKPPKMAEHASPCYPRVKAIENSATYLPRYTTVLEKIVRRWRKCASGSPEPEPTILLICFNHVRKERLDRGTL